MNRIVLCVGVTAMVFFGRSTWGKDKAKAVVPASDGVVHSHHAEQGGRVLMFGDDHLELTRSSMKGTLDLVVSDKFRKPVPVTKFKITLQAVVDGKNQVLKLEPDVHVPSKIFALIKGLDSDTKLKIGLIRITAPKGHFISKSLQSLRLSEVPVSEASGHEGH